MQSKYWLRENWFKVGLITLCSVAVLFTSFFFYKSLELRAKTAENQQILERTNECEQQAAREQDKLEKDNYVKSFEFKYIPGNGRCEVAYVTDSKSTAFLLSRHYVIQDLFSGTKLYESVALEPGAPTLEQQTKFEEARDEQLRLSI